jgi:predicted metal-dependent enzyme (double-stranded beta helix superfamily)
MEIWPAGHFSPIHSHAGAEAVIRVLEGGINVSLFHFLSDIEPFAVANFVKDHVMWISPTLNQIHQLRNIGKNTCVTIQCYMYDENNDKHYDYFDYLDETGAIQQYEPDSDMDFIAFKELMREEWINQPLSCCRRR